MISLSFGFNYDGKKYKAKVSYDEEVKNYDDIQMGQIIATWKIYDDGNQTYIGRTVADTEHDEIYLIPREAPELFDEACYKLGTINNDIWELCNWNCNISNEAWEEILLSKTDS